MNAPMGHRAVPDHVPPERVFPFDFRYDAQIRSDPWGVFHAQNQRPDIYYSPDLGGYWVITRTDLIEEVFRRHDLFSNGSVSIPSPPRPQSIPASLDPPEHTKYRKIMSQKMFSPRAMASLEADVHEISERLLAEFAGQGRCEFISAFARPLPVGLLLKMLGLPEAVRADLIRWARMMFHGQSVAENLEGYQHAFAYLGRWLDEQLAQPDQVTGHILPAMLEGRVDGRPLTRGEMHSMAMMLMGAGVDTVTSQMGHVMRFFAERPDQRQLLRERPELIPDAVEELLRRFGIANIARVAAGDFEYQGVRFRKGDLVLCCCAIAGLDARTFPDPLAVDFERPGVKAHHRPFGAGPHVCPGAHLARVVLRMIIETLLPRLANLRRAPGAAPEYLSGITVSMTRLELEFDPA
jgi:cytochrome P450